MNEDNIPYHDFCFSLIHACDYLEWFYQYDKDIVDKEDYSYLLCQDTEDNSYEFSLGLLLHDCVPVGDLDFVFRYIERKGLNYKKPINIPDVFLSPKYLKRNAFTLNNATLSDVIYTANYEFGNKDKFFLKKIDKYKEVSLVVEDNKEIHDLSVNLGDYFLSEYIVCAAEFRIFVFNNKIVDVRRYLGDYDVYPNINFVEDIIGVFSDIKDYSGLSSYTIDVGVLEKTNETVLIEIHPFVSCGLYGFDNKKLLPLMMNSGYKWMLKDNK